MNAKSPATSSFVPQYKSCASLQNRLEYATSLVVLDIVLLLLVSAAPTRCQDNDNDLKISVSLSANKVEQGGEVRATVKLSCRNEQWPLHKENWRQEQGIDEINIEIEGADNWGDVFKSIGSGKVRKDYADLKTMEEATHMAVGRLTANILGSEAWHGVLGQDKKEFEFQVTFAVREDAPVGRHSMKWRLHAESTTGKVEMPVSNTSEFSIEGRGKLKITFEKDLTPVLGGGRGETVELPYFINRTAQVKIVVTGKDKNEPVAVLQDPKDMPPGKHVIKWDGRMDDGSFVKGEKGTSKEYRCKAEAWYKDELIKDQALGGSHTWDSTLIDVRFPIQVKKDFIVKSVSLRLPRKGGVLYTEPAVGEDYRLTAYLNVEGDGEMVGAWESQWDVGTANEEAMKDFGVTDEQGKKGTVHKSFRNGQPSDGKPPEGHVRSPKPGEFTICFHVLKPVELKSKPASFRVRQGREDTTKTPEKERVGTVTPTEQNKDLKTPDNKGKEIVIPAPYVVGYRSVRRTLSFTSVSDSSGKAIGNTIESILRKEQENGKDVLVIEITMTGTGFFGLGKNTQTIKVPAVDPAKYKARNAKWLKEGEKMWPGYAGEEFSVAGITTRNVGYEDVKVPAGQFRCAKMVDSSVVTTEGGTVRTESTTWFGVPGIVKQRNDSWVDGTYTGNGCELLEFNVGISDDASITEKGPAETQAASTKKTAVVEQSLNFKAISPGNTDKPVGIAVQELVSFEAGRKYNFVMPKIPQMTAGPAKGKATLIISNSDAHRITDYSLRMGDVTYKRNPKAGLDPQTTAGFVQYTDATLFEGIPNYTGGGDLIIEVEGVQKKSGYLTVVLSTDGPTAVEERDKLVTAQKKESAR